MPIQRTAVARPLPTSNILPWLDNTTEDTISSSIQNTGISTQQTKQTEQTSSNVLSIDDFRFDVDKVKTDMKYDDEKALGTVIDYYKSKWLTVKGYEWTFTSQIPKISDTSTEEEDLEWFDFWLKTSEFLTEIWEWMKIEWKFDIKWMSETEWFVDSFKNEWKRLLNSLRMIPNLPWDSIQFMWEMLWLVSNVVWTARSVKDISVWLADKMWLAEWTEEQQVMVTALWQAIEENFWTAEDAMETITQNPLDFFMVIWGWSALWKTALSKTKYWQTARWKQLIAKLDSIAKTTDPIKVIGAELKYATKPVKLLWEVVGKSYVKSTWVGWESVKNIIKDPKMFKQAELGKITRQSTADDIVKAIDKRAKDISDLGKEYSWIAKQTIKTWLDKKVKIVKASVDEYMVKNHIKVWKDWVLDFSNSKIWANKNRTVVQKAYDLIHERTDFKTGKDWLNLRQSIDDTINWQSWATTRAETVVRGIRWQIDNFAKWEFKGLEKLDNKFAPLRQEFNNISKLIRLKNWELKPNYVSVVANSTGKGKEILIERLKWVDPHIEAKVNALKALEDVELAKNIKVWDYMKWSVIWTSAVLWWVEWAVLAWFLTHPTALVTLLKGYTWSVEIATTIANKIKRGIKLWTDEWVIFINALKSQTKTKPKTPAPTKAKPKPKEKISDAEANFKDEVGFKKAKVSPSKPTINTKWFINPQQIVDDITKLWDNIKIPAQAEKLAKKIVIGMNLAKWQIKQAYDIVKRYIKEFWADMKDRLWVMIDEIADKIWIRSKFVDDAGKSYENILDIKVKNLDPAVAVALSKTKWLWVADIIKKNPELQLKRDVPVRDIHWNKSVIAKWEALTPYELKGNKILLQDWETYIVSKSQYKNITQNSVVQEAKVFNPEFAGTTETIKSWTAYWIYQKDWWWLVKSFNSKSSAEQWAKDFWKKYWKVEIRENPLDRGFTWWTKYEQYTLPWGKNYREILIQVPSVTKAELNKLWYTFKITKLQWKDWVEISKNGKSLWVKATEKWAFDFAYFQEWKKPFKSWHYDEPNIVSTLRMKERTYNGKKVWFMEEMQSDWALAGRKQWFIGDKGRKVFDDYVDILKKKYNTDAKIIDQKLLTQTEKIKYQELFDSIQNFWEWVPNTPLLKNWKENTVKRGLFEATKNGDEYFSWTTWKQQKARYDLSKQIDDIEWYKWTETGSKQVTIRPKNWTVISLSIDNNWKVLRTMQESFKWKNIEDIVWKWIWDKIKTWKEWQLKWLDLNIGWEWANNLYDREIKNIVEKVTWGKVEYIDMWLESWGASKKFIQFDWDSLNYKQLRASNNVKRISDKKEFVITSVNKTYPWKFKGASITDRQGLVKEIIKNERERIWKEIRAFPDNSYLLKEELRLLPTNINSKTPSQLMKYLYDTKHWKEEILDLWKGVSELQPAIKLTPEIKRIIKWEAPEIKKP